MSFCSDFNALISRRNEFSLFFKTKNRVGLEVGSTD